MDALRGRFVAGAVTQQGIKEETAQRIFDQLSGFAGYGFCKSHGASFALIAYQTLWLEHYHAPAFYVALLNQRPMGFYSPEVILDDARRHGVELPPDVSSRLPRDTLQALIRAGGLDSLAERLDLLWRLGELQMPEGGLDLTLPASEVALPSLTSWEQTVWEYELLGYAPGTQVMVHYREDLRDAGVLSTWQVKQARAGQRVVVAGMSVVRQRPGTAQGMVFVSLEDESGLLDLVIRPNVYAQMRGVLRDHPLLMVTGLVQRAGTAVNVLVQTAAPLVRS